MKSGSASVDITSEMLAEEDEIDEVDIAEVELALHKMKQDLSPDDVYAVMKDMDDNGNGRLDRKEFKELLLRLDVIREDALRTKKMVAATRSFLYHFRFPYACPDLKRIVARSVFLIPVIFASRPHKLCFKWPHQQRNGRRTPSALPSVYEGLKDNHVPLRQCYIFVQPPSSSGHQASSGISGIIRVDTKEDI